MSELTLPQMYVLWNVMGFAFLGLNASREYMSRNARLWLHVGVASALSAGAIFGILVVPRLALDEIWFAGVVFAFFGLAALKVWQRYRKAIARDSG